MPDQLIPLAGMYMNQSQKSGRRYFTGYLGKAKLVMLEDTRAEEGQPGWTLFVAERPAKADAGGKSRTDTPRPSSRTVHAGKAPTSTRPTTRAQHAADHAHRPFDDPLDDIR